MNKHIFKRILLTIDVYMILLENGFIKEEALAVTYDEIQHNAYRKAEKNAFYIVKNYFDIFDSTFF